MRSATSIKSRKSASLIVGSFFTATLLLILILAYGNNGRVQAQTPDDEGQKYANMDPLLNEIVEQYERGEFAASAAAESSPADSGGTVGVIFLTESGEADSVREFLEENGAFAGPAYDGFVGADVPISLLASASQQDGVYWMQASIPPHAAEGGSPGHPSGQHGEDVWHEAGLKGEGVKVGIISYNFSGFENAMGTTLPSEVEARCFIGYGVYSTDLTDCVGRRSNEDVGSGTIAVEAVFNIAPEASYFVANVRSQIDLLAAVRWMVDNDVDVISSPLSWVWSGPGDGTSPLLLSELNTVDEAVEGGITWIAPAGNDAKATWYGSFDDADGNGFHNFASGGEDECNRVYLEPREFYMALIRWDEAWFGQQVDESNDRTELKIHLLNEDTSTTLRRSYSRYWTRIARAPLEFLYFYNSGLTERTYCLKVELIEGDAPEWMQLQSFFGEDMEHHTLFGSIASPAESANPGLLAVGIGSLADPNVIWERSSRGPTPDGRLKPGVVGGQHEGEAVTHGVEDDEYTSGTGHESAHIAGLAVLVKQRFPEFEPKDVVSYLKDNAVDRGERGPDNTWGYGFATLPASDADVCILRIYGDQNIKGNWGSDCLSENRPGDEQGPGDGDYYARFYTITLEADKKITVNLSSEEDTYLYLMNGAGRDGAIEAYNDDITRYTDLDSRIVFENREAGEFTIEATTYGQERGGEFTLTVEIADAEEEPAPEPQPIPSASGPFTDFSRGTDHVCALNSDGVIVCWGNEDNGQTTAPEGEFSALSSGQHGTCALRNDGAVMCWGSFDVEPSSDTSAMGPFEHISRGSDHACALDSEGAITCWGSNSYGQATPPDGEFNAIMGSEHGSCALRNDDALVCWGSLEVSP